MKALRGPYPLDYEAIAHNVPPSTGVFVLGYSAPDGRFCTTQVTRADENLRTTLLGQLGREKQFKYLRSPTTEAAFHAECQLFHTLSPMRTKLHPARPPGSSWVCPVCSRGRPLRKV